IVFNVSKSINAQGSNALEVLGRAPGVFVGTDNSISLNGKSGATILIDGRQTYLSGREIAELLRAMPSSEIRSIEIINSPGAKYDAAGTAGMINIKTLKSNIQGFSGSLSTGFSYGIKLRSNQDVSASYRNNKFNIYGSYNHSIGHYVYKYGSDRIQEGNFYNSFTDDTDKRNRIGSRIGVDYNINKHHTIGILLNGNFIFGGGITDTRTQIGIAQSGVADQQLDAINDYYHQRTERYNMNLNYKYEDTLGTVINFDADLGDFTKGSGNLQTNKYTSGNVVISDNLYRSVNAIDIGLSALKFDYARNLWKGKLETGLKYSSVTARNSTDFLNVQPTGETIDPTRSNAFDYVERIAAAYVNYKKDLGKKWQFQTGLRIENSASEGELAKSSVASGNVRSTRRNYTNLFPFAGITLRPSPSHNLSLNYSRRIDRPAYQSLNPFIYLLDELSFWQGNPFLKPQLSHRGVLQYVYKTSTILGLSFTHTSDFSVEITDTIDQNKIVMIPRNLGTQQHAALTVTQNISPAKWWQIVFNGTLFSIRNNVAFDLSRKMDLRQTAARLNLQQTFKLPYNITGELVNTFNSRRLAGANQFARPTSIMDIGLQKSFAENKANLRLIFSDIYKGSKASAIQSVDGLYLRNYSYFETRQIKINFSYKFATGSSKG
ncbi:MAG: TonB-dependent receptor, partial [Pedobacter sp.]